MWLLINVLILTIVSVLSVPYGYNDFNSLTFGAREMLPNENNRIKISHTLSTSNKDYGLMQHLIPPSISNIPNYYSFAPVTTQLPSTAQLPVNYIAPVIARQHYLMPVIPRINYLPSVVTTRTPVTELNVVPAKKPHNDLEYQNTQHFEKAFDDSDDDEDDNGEYSQKYSAGSSQKQQKTNGNDPRDTKIQKPEAKLPERKDRIDFQVYGFDGPKSYKFGYDTGKGENRQFRYETRDREGNVSGRYGYVDRTGKLNVVKYTSNADDGFRTEAL